MSDRDNVLRNFLAGLNTPEINWIVSGLGNPAPHNRDEAIQSVLSMPPEALAQTASQFDNYPHLREPWRNVAEWQLTAEPFPPGDGSDQDREPGTVIPTVVQVPGGQRTIKYTALPPGASFTPPLPVSSACAGDYITLRCTASELNMVTIFNGERKVLEVTKLRVKDKVTHWGCYTHWTIAGNPGRDKYVPSGIMGGLPLP